MPLNSPLVDAHSSKGHYKDIALRLPLSGEKKSKVNPDDERGVAGVPTGRSLARSPPAAAGMAARFSNNLQSLAPALRFHLQASSKRTYAYTTRSHRTPPVGVQSQGTQHKQAHTYTKLQSSGFPNGKCSLQWAILQWSTIIISQPDDTII